MHYQPGGFGEEIPVPSNDTEIHKLVQADVKSDVYKKLPSSANAALTVPSVTVRITDSLKELECLKHLEVF